MGKMKKRRVGVGMKKKLGIWEVWVWVFKMLGCKGRVNGRSGVEKFKIVMGKVRG